MILFIFSCISTFIGICVLSFFVNDRPSWMQILIASLTFSLAGVILSKIFDGAGLAHSSISLLLTIALFWWLGFRSISALIFGPMLVVALQALQAIIIFSIFTR